MCIGDSNTSRHGFDYIKTVERFQVNLHEGIPEVEKEINKLLNTEDEQIIDNENTDNSPLPIIETENLINDDKDLPF